MMNNDNDKNESKENVFFSLDDPCIEFNNEDTINDLLNDFEYKNQINNLTDKEIIESLSIEYKFLADNLPLNSSAVSVVI